MDNFYLDIEERKSLSKALEGLDYCHGLLSELSEDASRITKENALVSELESKYSGLIGSSSVEKFRETMGYYPGNESLCLKNNYEDGLLFIKEMAKKVWEFIKTIWGKIVSFFKKFLLGFSSEKMEIKSYGDICKLISGLYLTTAKPSDIWKTEEEKAEFYHAIFNTIFSYCNRAQCESLLDAMSSILRTCSKGFSYLDKIKKTGLVEDVNSILGNLKSEAGITFTKNLKSGDIESSLLNFAFKDFSEGMDSFRLDIRKTTHLNEERYVSNEFGREVLKYGKNDFTSEIESLAHRLTNVRSLPYSLAKELRNSIGKASSMSNGGRKYISLSGKEFMVFLELSVDDDKGDGVEKDIDVSISKIKKEIEESLSQDMRNGTYMIKLSGGIVEVHVLFIVKYFPGLNSLSIANVAIGGSGSLCPIRFESDSDSSKTIKTSEVEYIDFLSLSRTLSKEDSEKYLESVVGEKSFQYTNDVINRVILQSSEKMHEKVESIAKGLKSEEKKIEDLMTWYSENNPSGLGATCALTLIGGLKSLGRLLMEVKRFGHSGKESVSKLKKGLIDYGKSKGFDIKETEDGKLEIIRLK